MSFWQWALCYAVPIPFTIGYINALYPGNEISSGDRACIFFGSFVWPIFLPAYLLFMIATKLGGMHYSVLQKRQVRIKLLELREKELQNTIKQLEAETGT